MAVDNFIPTVWTAGILKNLNDAHIFASLLNRDYEKDLKGYGDTVKIGSIGRPTVTAYTKNGSINAPETLVGASQLLRIDQAYYENFEIDDIDNRQTKPKLMAEATSEAAWAMNDKVDTWVADLLNAAVPTANIRTAATVGTGASDADMYEVLVDLDVLLSKQNVPRAGRWVVIGADHEGLLRKDPRMVSFGSSDNRSALSGTGITKDPISGFRVYVSNNVPSGTDIIAGYSGAATFAENLDEVRAFSPENSFSDALKMLHVWGGTVTRPYALAKVVATMA